MLSLALVLPGVALQVAVASPAAASPYASECPYPGGGSSGTCEHPLEVGVVARGDHDVTYPWSIQKDADKTRVEVASGGAATFTYTVTVRAGSAVRSGWTLAGEVAVENPNPDEVDVTAVTVTTDLGGGAMCSPTTSGPWTVPGDTDGPGGDGGVLDVPFVCTFTAEPAASGTVQATVAWQSADTAAEVTAEGDAPVTSTVDDETDEVVDVVDDQTVPGQRILLAEDLEWSSGLVRSYSYSLTFAAPPAGTCTTRTNVATVDLPSSTDVTDSAAVEVCTTPAPPVVAPAPPAPAPETVAPPVPVPVTTVPPPTAPEVAPDQAAGRAVGRLRVSCQGTVHSRVTNRTPRRVEFSLRVGSTVRHVWVRSGGSKELVARGGPRQQAVLRAEGRVLDRARIPERCAPPEVLPETGLRGATAARVAAVAHRWR